MKKIAIVFIIICLSAAIIKPHPAFSAAARSGYILLQTEKNGEAWYVYPVNSQRYFLGRPADAFAIMKKLALGVKHNLIASTEKFPARLSGLILLDTEQNGEAYYIYPPDNKKYFLGRPADAFKIMGQLGQGISNSGIEAIPIGNISNPTTPADAKILQDVPFTSQAPFGGWSDLRQEDGCEEAASLMAVSWARGQSLTKQGALDQILGSSAYTQKKYGEYRDISSADTLNWIIKDYFNYQNADRKTNVSLADIIDELKQGHIIIAPMNGQLLHNPNFKQPGPLHHMVVIRGYDPLRKIFITNDPGTRKGELYEYDIDILYKAIRDYTTGFQQSDSTVKKNIIIVWK